jgi:hypothetical protein
MVIDNDTVSATGIQIMSTSHSFEDLRGWEKELSLPIGECC